MKKFFLLGNALFFTFFLVISFSACEKETPYTNNDAKLRFSRDTLRFDTVFTSVGSATRSFKVFNPYNQPLVIDKIYLEKGQTSIFNLNIDGVSGDAQEKIEIPANDSIYIFAEVTINPNDQNNPFIIDENVMFETNGNVQKIVLEAWGQNANYIPANDAKGKIAAITTDLVWDDPKPYIIYGILVIDGAKLTLPAGARVYVHGGIVRTFNAQNQKVVYNDGMIFVQNGGSIEAQGTAKKPVVIGGDRLEKQFENVPSQWNLMYVGPNCDAKFAYTTIKNARLGLYADSAATVTMNYSTVANTAGPGVFARAATVTMDNCLVYNNGDASISAIEGGNYDFNYCTFANHGNNASAMSLANLRCAAINEKTGDCAVFSYNTLNVNVVNTIISSSQPDALSFVKSDKAGFNYTFSNNLIKADKSPDVKTFPTFYTKDCKDCIKYTKGRLFKSIDKDNYRLDTLSVAEMKATPLPNFTQDLDGTPRDAQKPDIGAYEYKPK
jgi:Right handed beta helix region